MNPEFIKSINTAEASDGEFFIVNFGAKSEIKIFFEKTACDWVWNYKYQYRQDVLQIKEDIDTTLDTNKIALINYFFTFIIDDISSLNSHISPKIKTVLDIGAGLGLFNLFLNQVITHKVSFDLIEVEKLESIEHVTNNPEITQKLDANVQINPVDTLRKLMIKNNADNINVIKNTSIHEHLNKEYDLVLSFRSWGFLYDLDLYKEFVKKTLTSDGVVITNLTTHDDSIEKFTDLFDEVILINEFPNNKRFLGKNLKKQI